MWARRAVGHGRGRAGGCAGRAPSPLGAPTAAGRPPGQGASAACPQVRGQAPECHQPLLRGSSKDKTEKESPKSSRATHKSSNSGAAAGEPLRPQRGRAGPRHCVLAFSSSSLCTVLYSRSKCWGQREGASEVTRGREQTPPPKTPGPPARSPASGQDVPGRALPAHLHGRVGHSEVGADADGQEQVKNGWFDPGGREGEGSGAWGGHGPRGRPARRRRRPRRALAIPRTTAPGK